MVLILAVIYFSIGLLFFAGLMLTDEFTWKKWLPVFLVSVFLWPLLLFAC